LTYYAILAIRCEDGGGWGNEHSVKGIMDFFQFYYIIKEYL
jgi:hypothetical protein